jgi:hypothetical protein
MELNEFVGKCCRSGSAFEFSPKKNGKIDLEKTCDALSLLDGELKCVFEVKTRVVVILKFMGLTISIFETGKILVRGTDEKEAKKIAEKIVPSIVEKKIS